MASSVMTVTTEVSTRAVLRSGIKSYGSEDDGIIQSMVISPKTRVNQYGIVPSWRGKHSTP